MKRVLLGQGLPPSTAELLRQEGWEAVHTSEIGMAKASDPEILAEARENKRVCITLDRDFHAKLALTSEGSPSVVLLRWERLRAAELKDLLVKVWRDIEKDLERGAAVTVTERAVRVRRLPIRPAE